MLLLFSDLCVLYVLILTIPSISAMQSKQIIIQSDVYPIYNHRLLAVWEHFFYCDVVKSYVVLHVINMFDIYQLFTCAIVLMFS